MLNWLRSKGVEKLSSALVVVPDKARLVIEAEAALNRAAESGASPRELSRLHDTFTKVQQEAAGKPALICRSNCPNCGAPAEHVPGMRSDRQRCTRCACEFSSPEQPIKACPRCASPLTVKFSHGTHCNSCGNDF